MCFFPFQIVTMIHDEAFSVRFRQQGGWYSGQWIIPVLSRGAPGSTVPEFSQFRAGIPQKDLADTDSGPPSSRPLLSSLQQVVATRQHSDQGKINRICLGDFGGAFVFLLKGKAEEKSSLVLSLPFNLNRSSYLVTKRWPPCRQKANVLRKVRGKRRKPKSLMTSLSHENNPKTPYSWTILLDKQ